MLARNLLSVVIVVAIAAVSLAQDHLPTPDYNRQPSDPAWLAQVVQLHGHLGPSVVAGARMGMIGRDAVGARGYFDVEVTCEGPLAQPPQACFLDGIQAAAGATTGKRTLNWVQADKLVVRVRNTLTGKTVEVQPTPALLGLLASFKPEAKAGTARGPGQQDHERLEEIARKIAAMPEKEVAIVTKIEDKQATGEVKWHPGHYAFVQFSELHDEHVYKNFRGVQKTYAWRTLEPEKDRYDFSAIRADLAFLGKHDKRLVIQVQTKTFGSGQNYCPPYLSGLDYGGGVYRTRWGSFNPILWDERVNRRLNALYAMLGKELDREPFLEAVVIPESATTFEVAVKDELHYTAEKYASSVKAGMQAIKDAFPATVVIQYVNMPPEVIQPLADYAQAHGIGFGGPDIYPFDPVLTNPHRGVYRLYAPLSGVVPLGAAVQWNDYTQSASFRGAMGETPVKEIYEFGRDKLRLNYIFWGTRPGYFEKVQAMLAAPSFPNDPAGGLNTVRPKSVGGRIGDPAVFPKASS